MNCTEIVLLIVVCIGILVPCFTVAFSLFCVMTLGFESNLPTPLASAAVMKKSTAKFGERCPRNSPLVGATAERKVFNGRLLPLLPEVENGGGGAMPVLVPTAESPPKKDRPPVVRPAKPN